MFTSWLYGFRLTFRRLFREGKYTFINIFSLSLSLAAALLIFIYLAYETSYDRHHKNHENIYRIGTDISLAGERHLIAMNSIPIGPLLVEHVAGFNSYARIFPVQFFFRNLVYRYADKSFQENGVLATDPAFFRMFTFDFLEGNAETALSKPFSLVLTQRMKERYFGKESAYGRAIEIEGAGHFTVTAVVSDPKPNSHLQFDGLFPISTFYQLDHLFHEGFQHGDTWEYLKHNPAYRIVWVYVKTDPDFDPMEFAGEKWTAFYREYSGDQSVYDDLQPVFQPLADIHLTSKLGYEMTTQTNTVTIMSPLLVRIFTLIGVFLLVLASINYTNMSLSQANSRGKETSMKKVLGAGRTNLMLQFFAESVLTTLFALLLALFLLEVSLPSVNQLLGTPLNINILENRMLISLFLGIAIFTGIIAGAYPALYYSGISPLKILTIRYKSSKETLGLKKILIVIQFVISVFMIIATIVVTLQLHFIHNKNLGFDRDHMVIIELKDSLSRQGAHTLKEKLLQHPDIHSAALSNYFPSRIAYTNAAEVNTAAGPLAISTHIIQIGDNYLDFMNIELLEGRTFSYDTPWDYHHSVIINQTAQRLFGWKEPLGKKVNMTLVWPDGTNTGEREVVGVVRDFHISSLKRTIPPLIIYPMASQAVYLNVKINPDNHKAAMQTIEQVWEQERPGYPLVYYFLDQLIANMYHSQRVTSIFFGIFALLCIFIAFLGLYGLSAYSVEQRTREIGIRKVLGADISAIIYTLSREFLGLVIIAALVASLAAWYFLDYWLAGFAYHVKLTAVPFLLAIALSCLVAFLAMITHVYKASRLNPADAIKYE